MKTRKSILFTFTTLLIIPVMLFSTGCSTEELKTAHTVSTGEYQIEILAPGGEFREGEIPLTIRATRNGEVVELNEGRVDLHMAAMGAMPRMDTGTGFTKSGSELQGEIFFEMDGSWQGALELTTAGGETISESLRLRVK